jgi:hypothetical protein
MIQRKNEGKAIFTNHSTSALRIGQFLNLTGVARLFCSLAKLKSKIIWRAAKRTSKFFGAYFSRF